MKYTNHHNLHRSFVRAVENDVYDNGGSDFTATSLSDPPRLSALYKKHKDELEQDVVLKSAALLGQGVHSIAERAARELIDICETRFFAKFEVDGKKYLVSAQVDLYETDSGDLIDWKTSKAYAFSKKARYGQKEEWIIQLNVAAEMLRRNGYMPTRLVINGFMKNWEEKHLDSENYLHHIPGYPEAEAKSVYLPMWSTAQVTNYIQDRIRLHSQALLELPECSRKDTWNGNRCKKWCPVNKFCTQYNGGGQDVRSETYGIMEEKKPTRGGILGG